jgi:NAD(P)-dependent dehydrogenase (short-subunit alcohol dehydrogenase family)
MRYMSNKGGANENTAGANGGGGGGGSGAIVNVSSGSAVIGRPLLYAMSKAGPC